LIAHQEVEIFIFEEEIIDKTELIELVADSFTNEPRMKLIAMMYLMYIWHKKV
jgi:hypothetical protein